MNAIRTRGLRKTFRTGFWMRPVEAVKEVDLEVKAGEIFGFIGPNGAGKTTTIKVLTGLVMPTSGEAWVNGLPVSDPESRAQLGFLPEGTFFHDYLTASEFLDFHGSLLGIPRDVRRERIPKLLERVGLAHAAERQIRRYSKGMRQRAGLAQALIGEPQIVILDEPMSGLDPLGRKDVRDLILSLRDEGKTVFFSSHILEDAEVICDQVALILSGRIVKQGYLDELLGQEMVGSELVVEGIDESLFAELQGRARRAVVQGHRFLLEFAGESDGEKALDQVRQSGGRIRSYVPKRKSLEDLLLEGLAQEKDR
ncbi:MAG TPA: ABC transporter ATP-binding protein [Myxococcota bacterium]|nr:ABC transporter ATP-binding protein [Myxococcota bacterium]